MNPGDSICLITGITSGIGRAAAEKFASAGCELILVARNRHRGEKTVEEISSSTLNKKIRLYTGDLSSAQDIRQLSDEIHRDYERIDILVNNAGAYFSKFHLTIDGIEATYSVNYLSRFLLSNQLLDLLLKSAAGKIISVSGESHRRGKLDFSVQTGNNYSPVRALARAKLADIIFTMELAKRLQSTPIQVISIHPGAVATAAIYNDPDASWSIRFLYSMFKPIFRKASSAGNDIFCLAFNEKLKYKTGSYFIRCKEKLPSDTSRDTVLASRLWEFSESLTGYTNSLFKHNKLLVEK